MGTVFELRFAVATRNVPWLTSIGEIRGGFASRGSQKSNNPVCIVSTYPGRTAVATDSLELSGIGAMRQPSACPAIHRQLDSASYAEKSRLGRRSSSGPFQLSGVHPASPT